MPLESPALVVKDEDDLGMNKSQEWSQTGYKPTLVGMILYALIILAHGIIHFLLFALVVEYCEYPIFQLNVVATPRATDAISKLHLDPELAS